MSNSRGMTGFGAMDLDYYIFRNDYKLERKINCDNKYIKYEIDEKSIKSALDSLLDTEDDIELLDFDDIEILDNIENSDFVNGGVEILETEKVSEESLLLSEFVEKFRGKNSKDNSVIVNNLYDYFVKTIGNNSVSREILKIMLNLKAKNELNFETTKERSHCADGKVRINFQDTSMYVIFHELGHALFNRILKTELPQNFKAIVEEAKANANNQVIEQLNRKYERELNHYFNQERQNLIEKYHKTYNEIIELRAEQVKRKDVNAYKKEQYRKFPESKKYLEQMSREDIARTIANFKTHEEILDAACIKLDENCGYLLMLEDIVSNVYERMVLNFGHDENYYKKNSKLSFHEMFANFTSLVLNGDDIKYLGLIKKMFGENFFNMIKDKFEELSPGIKLDEKAWDYEYDDNLIIKNINGITEEITEKIIDNEATEQITEKLVDNEATEQITEKLVDNEATEQITEKLVDNEATEQITEKLVDNEVTEQF